MAYLAYDNDNNLVEVQPNTSLPEVESRIDTMNSSLTSLQSTLDSISSRISSTQSRVNTASRRTPYVKYFHYYNSRLVSFSNLDSSKTIPLYFVAKRYWSNGFLEMMFYLEVSDDYDTGFFSWHLPLGSSTSSGSIYEFEFGYNPVCFVTPATIPSGLSGTGNVQQLSFYCGWDQTRIQCDYGPTGPAMCYVSGLVNSSYRNGIY